MTATRTIATQSIEELGGAGSVLARQRRDHVELDRLLEELDGLEGDRQRAHLRQIWRLVFSHAFAEEAVLWPAIRQHVDDGEALTLRVEQEHQEINRLVVELEQLQPDADRWDPTLARVVELLRTDVREEEDLLLARLQASLEQDALRRLGRRWEAVRRVAPTRPHPVVSRRPPGNALAAAPLAPLDRARDVLDAVALRVGGRVGAGATTLSRGLAGLAGAVEALPPLRRGERPSTEQSPD